jgi:hypothetical protein
LNYFFGFELPEDVKVDESFARLGICSVVDGTLRFTHETVAEFFLAYFLSKEIKKQKLNRETVRVLFDVLRDPKFKIVRMFLDLSLKTHGEFHKKLIEVFTPYEEATRNFDILKNSIEENNEHLVTAMTQKNHDGKSLFTLITGGEMLASFNDYLGCHFMLFASGRSSVTVIQKLSEYFEGSHYLELEHGRNIFHFASMDTKKS